jgi:hypothetical protein
MGRMIVMLLDYNFHIKYFNHIALGYEVCLEM